MAEKDDCHGHDSVRMEHCRCQQHVGGYGGVAVRGVHCYGQWPPNMGEVDQWSLEAHSALMEGGVFEKRPVELIDTLTDWSQNRDSQ